MLKRKIAQMSTSGTCRMRVVTLFIIVLCAFSGLTFAKETENDNLRVVHVFFRHGDRTPDRVIPNDPTQADSWPGGLEQLTQLGMQQAYALGEFLKQRYTGFLNTSFYDRRETHMRSTNKDRTLMSAECVLSAIFHPGKSQLWNPEIMWQPVPVHTRWTEPVIDMDTPCQTYTDMFNEKVYGSMGQEYYEENKEFILEVSQLAGLQEPSLELIWDLYDPLFIERAHNVSWPSWVTEDIYNKLEKMRLNKYDFWYDTDAMKRLKGGLFVNELVQSINALENGTADANMKMFLYSSHDSAMIGTMQTLGIWDRTLLPYSTALIFEIHQEQNGKMYLKILYKNDTTTNPSSPPYEFKLKGCKVKCPAENFKELQKYYVIDEATWYNECEASGVDTATLIGIGVGVVVALLAAVLLGIYCLRTHKKHAQEEYLKL